MKVIIRRPYAKITSEGEAVHSIVAYGKHPWMMGDVKQRNGRYETDVFEWVHKLSIDLWLFVLRFRWRTKKGKFWFYNH